MNIRNIMMFKFGPEFQHTTRRLPAAGEVPYFRDSDFNYRFFFLWRNQARYQGTTNITVVSFQRKRLHPNCSNGFLWKLWSSES